MKITELELKDNRDIGINPNVADVVKVVDLGDIYSYAGTNIGMVSRYPTYNPDRDNEDYFAQRQTTTDKLANTAKTFATLASNTYANHFYGYGRTTKALASGDWDKLWKDSFGEESANIVQAQANLNPIYETKAQTARMNSGDGAWGAFKQYVPFTGRAGNAWASLAGQAGFMVGTIGAVAAEEVALLGITALSGGTAAPATGTKTVTNTGKVMKSFYSLFSKGKQLNTIQNAAEAGNAVAKVIRSKPVEIARMYMAAAGEASIEANSRFLEFKADQIEQYKNKYGTEPDQAFLQQIEENGIKAGNATFGFNIPVLMTGNLLTIGNMFKPGNLLLAKATREGLQESSKLLSSKAVLGGFLKNFPRAEKLTAVGLKTASFLNKDKVSEGIEELLQGAGSRAAQHKYDLFNSDETADLSNYLVGVADELSHSLGTREGWDEFFSGYMTGFGLNIGKAAIGVATGKNKKVQTAVEQEVADLDNAHQNMMKQYSEVQETVNDPFQTANNNVITQNAVSNATEQAISDNDVYEGKNLKVDAKIALFSHLNLRDIGKEYFTLLANNINALKNTGKEEDLVTFEEMTKGRSVEEIAQGLEKEYATFQKIANQTRKNSKNNYKEGTSMYNLREHIINYAAGVELASTDAKQRAEGIQSKIVSEGKIDENVLQALLEPEMLGESISALKSSLETFREAAKVQVGESKVISEKEVAKVEEKLALLETLQKATQQKGQSTQDLVASVLKGYFGDANMASQEVKRDLADLLELNNDAQVYTNLYNLLSNKEYFETFAESFQKTVLSQYQAKAQKAKEANYQPPSTTKERISKEELEAELGKEGIKNLPELLAFKEALEIVDAISIKGGKIKYEGKEFETPADLLEHLLKGKDETRKAIESQGLKDLFTARLNEVIGNEIDEKEPLIKEPVIPANQPAYINNSGPKSKETAEEENFAFRTSAVGQTLLHYFDLVIGNIWGTEGIDSIRKALEKGDKLETLAEIDKAIVDVGGNASVTLIYLTNEESLFAEEGSKEKVNNSADIKVVTDGIRFYLITSESAIKEDGSKKTAQEIIEENLGLQVQGSRQAAIVRDRNGNTLVSPFRENTFDETSDNAIHTLERGQSVSLKVADNEYNRELLLKKNRKEITEKEYIDQLTVHAYIIDKNGDEAIVGILRATDFLFESNEAKKTEIEKYRQRLNGLSLGQHFGNTTYTNATVAEGRNRADGKIVYTKLAEYNPPYYNTEFFYVTPSGIINEKGEAVDIAELGMASARNGAVYMKLTGKSNDKHYTVQTYGETSQADFLSGEFKNTMETYLTQDTPIISKRIIVDLGNISEADNESTKAEQVEEQLQEALPLGYSLEVEEDEDIVVKENLTENEEIEEDQKLETKREELSHRSKRKVILNRDPESPEEYIVQLILRGEGLSNSYLNDRLGYGVKDNPYLGPLVKNSKKLGNKRITVEHWYENMPEELRDTLSESDFENTLLDILMSYQGTGNLVESFYKKIIQDFMFEGWAEEEIVAWENTNREKRGDLTVAEEEALLQEIKERSKYEVIIIDKSGAKVTISNPKIEGNNVIHDNGIIHVTDIQSVEEVDTVLEVHDNSKEWSEVSVKGKEVIYNWLLTNGQVGTTYTTAEGVEVTVLFNDGTRIITRSVKGENIIDTLFSEGEFSTSISAKDLKVSGEIGQGQLALEEGNQPLSLEEAVTSQKETTPKKRAFTMLNVLKEQMAIHGVTESHIKRLQTAYQDSVLAGTPINGLSELMEKAGFTEEEIALMELTLSTATHQNFWEYITQSETFYEEKVLEDYLKVKEEMASYIEQLASIPLGDSPVEVENKYIDDTWNKLKSTFSKIGSITFELDKLSSIPREAIAKVTTALQELMEEDSFDNLEAKLREVGVKIRLKGLLYSQKVDRWSLGRNPKRADSFNSIQNDVRMFSENYVRNEADGLFVEITPSRKKSTQEIRKIQKLFVDLLGVNVGTKYLHSYKKVNGNFEGLMDRLQLEQMKEKNVAVQELVNIPKEDIVESTKDFIVTKRKGDRLFQDGERYNLLSVDNTENRVYLKEGSTISTADYNRLTKNPKKTSTYINRNTTLGKKAVRIKKELAKITCKA